MTNEKHWISSCKKKLAKRSNVKVWGDGLPAIKSYYHLITRSRDKWKFQILFRSLFYKTLGRPNLENYNETWFGQIKWPDPKFNVVSIFWLILEVSFTSFFESKISGLYLRFITRESMLFCYFSYLSFFINIIRCLFP